jgi:hypothetical protein
VLVLFVTVDGEGLARFVFRKAQNSIGSNGQEWKVKEVKTIRIIIYLNEIFHRKI